MISKIEEQINKFGICTECNNIKSNFNWCPSCNCAKLIKNFNDWTSGNDELDKFIRYTQSMAKSYLSYLEWIPYERFENVIKIASGALSDVYSATWKDGERIDNYWDNKDIYERSQPIPVALKYHKNVDNFEVIMKTLKCHHKCMSIARNFIRHYGVTKDSKTDDFMIVMQYANDGSLKEFCRKNKIIKHNWQWKLNILHYLAQDLSVIHNAGLIHCDISSENVYIRDDRAYLGQLYWSISSEKLEAKELIMGKANDIRRFGLLMISIATNKYDCTNYLDKTYKIPKSVLKLIKSCLDKDFKKRPDISKILYILEKWCGNPQHEILSQFEDAL